MDSEKQTGVVKPRTSLVAVTGATGYVGARVVPRLLDAGHRVRCLVRSPRKLSDRAWAADPDVAIVQADLEDATGLAEHLRGCEAMYFLVHSMMSSRNFSEKDLILARACRTAAAAAGVKRIIYLGGLGDTDEGLSEHLQSRREVERELSSGPVPVTVLRAAMIVGAGSASFEILRYLVERLPVMVTPRWVSTESQPIAIRNVLHYLVTCLAVPATTGATLEIGGPDVLSYRDLMRIMAEERGLPRRHIVPVPVLTPFLSSLWIHLVTPISARMARPLAEGLRNRVVVKDDTALRLMPQPLLTAREAIAAALAAEARSDVESWWSAAGPIPGDPDWAGGKVFVDTRTTFVNAEPARVFAAVTRTGGRQGWRGFNRLWRLRGALDRLVGGPGLRRGRRDPEHLSYGDALDFWRVTDIEANRRLVLRAEMKLPGDAVLEFEVQPAASPDGATLGTALVQTARFRPRGLLGLAYWYSVLPFHHFVFNGLAQGIRREAETPSRASEPAPSVATDKTHS